MCPQRVQRSYQSEPSKEIFLVDVKYTGKKSVYPEGSWGRGAGRWLMEKGQDGRVFRKMEAAGEKSEKAGIETDGAK